MATPEISGVAATRSTIQSSDEIEVKELKARIANGPSTPPWMLTATPDPGTGEVRLTWKTPKLISLTLCMVS